MKKLFPGILATMMCFSCVATACNQTQQDPTPTPDAIVYDLTAAKNYVKAQYIDTIGESRADYKVVNSVVISGYTYTVDWSVDVASGVVIKEFSDYTKIDCDQALAEDLDYVLTATLTAPDGSQITQTFEGTVLAMSATVAAPISAAPVDGTAYKFYVFQAATGNDCYINGKMKNTYYFATTNTYEDGIDVYSEATDGGFYLYHNAKGEGDATTKTYINVVKSGTHTNAKYETTASTVWTFSEEYGTIVTTLDGSTWYLGCDGTYETVEPQNKLEETYYKGYLVNIADRTTVSDANKIMDATNKLNLAPIFVGETEYELAEQGDVFPEVKIAWALTDPTATTATIENGILKLTNPAETTQISLTATLTIGDETATKVLVINHVPNNTKAMLEAASLLKSGQKFPMPMTVTGTVTSIKTPYDSSYANVTIVIDVEGVSVECYRLAGVGADVVAVNDTVTVTGTIEKYNSTVQFGQGCTLDELSPKVYTAAEKVAIEKEAIEIDAAITGAKEITLPTAGETFADVAISWAVAESAIATIENNTLTITEAAEATTVVVTATVVCGDVTETKVFEIAVSPVGSATTASKTIAELITQYGWTSSTTKQEFNLDEVVTVKINGGSNTGKAYNNDHIRIYATDTPAGTITISVPAGYELVSVKVSTQTGTYAFLCVDGTSTDISNQTVEVSGSSVVLNSVKNGSDGKQVRVTAIEVVYQAA